MMNRIAVLMTCYNREQTTFRCLKQLFEQILPDRYVLDVWLVDDASPDGTGDKVRASFPQVHVVQGPGELFWCKGMRLAWDEALKHEQKQSGQTANLESRTTNHYKHFLWLNDDVVLKDGAIAGLLSDWEMVGGVIVGTFSSDTSESDVSYGATRCRPDGHPHVGDTGMNGNLVLVPRSVFEKVGPIYGGYHHQYGDYDYGWQIRKHGLEYYASSRFCGICPQQPERYAGRLSQYGVLKRMKLLFDPKGYSLHDAYLYKYRNWGLFRALISVGHITMKVLLAMT